MATSPRKTNGTAAKKSGGRTPKGKLSFRAAAIQILEKEGKPLHLDVLTERAEKLGVKTTNKGGPKHAMAVALWVGKDKVFKHTGPSTFGLIPESKRPQSGRGRRASGSTATKGNGNGGGKGSTGKASPRSAAA